MTAAYECYQKAVDISPSVAHDLIQVLKSIMISLRLTSQPFVSHNLIFAFEGPKAGKCMLHSGSL